MQKLVEKFLFTVSMFFSRKDLNIKLYGTLSILSTFYITVDKVAFSNKHD